MKLKFELTTDPIDQLLDALPATSVTTHVLNALDYVVPGQWQNVTGFENSIRTLTGETDSGRVKAIARQAQKLYSDPQTGYQRAVWIYQTVDKADKVLAAAALANKVGEQVNFLSFLSNLTPKAEVTQSIDLSLKITAEVLAYGFVQGLPREGLMAFMSSLQTYTGTNIMRLVALICLDGIIPLGPDFMNRVSQNLEAAPAEQLEQNGVFQQIKEVIPGEDTPTKLNFVRQALAAVGVWMSNFQASHNLSAETLLENLKKVINFTDQTNDYLAAFLDATTNYFEHTGIQTVAHQLILKAAETAPRTTSARGKSISAARPNRPRTEGDATWLQTYLNEMGLRYESTDGDNILLISYGKTSLTLAPGYDEQVGDYVDIASVLVVDVPELNKKAARYLLELSHYCTFGGYYYDPSIEQVGYSYRLLASMADESTLAMVIISAGEIAKTVGRELAELTGGNPLRGNNDGYPDLGDYIEKGLSAKKLWEELDALLGDQMKYDKKEGAYYSKVGSTTLYVYLYKAEEFPIALVECYATIAADVDSLPLEAALAMLSQNGAAPLGTFCYEKEENYVYFSHVIPGDALDGDVLELMMAVVGETADDWDGEISDLIDG